MLFVLTLLLAPISLCFAIYRLVYIAVQMGSGRLRLHTTASIVPALLGSAAYLGLLAYTVALCGAMVWCLATQPQELSTIAHTILYFVAYPVVYVLAEWRIFYAFERVVARA